MDVELDLRLDLRATRPYLDLGGMSGPVHTQVLLHLANALAGVSTVSAPFQSNPPANLRWHIVGEARMLQYHAAGPEELAEALRSDRWQHLCDCVRNWHDVPAERRRVAASVLTRLGFYDTVLSLVPHDDISAPLDPSAAALLLIRANALYKRDGGSALATLDILHTVHGRASSARSRVLAAIAITVHHARVSRDGELVRHWAEQALGEIDAALEGQSSDHVLHSAVLRACSFAPFFAGDMAWTEEMLDECERLALAAPDSTSELAVLKAENLHAVLETRSRAAMRTGDQDLALARARQLTEVDPEDSRVHRDLGYMLLAHSGPAAALPSFERAAALGPPFAAVAWCLVAHCRRELHNPHGAMAALVTATELDPGSITALRGITDLAHPTGEQALGTWARDRIDALLSSHTTA
ncbi:hypothetical protein ITP53_03250 [Nonomuraea sp. K274]|uniref:Tetratricopeptide repeat protein n=1 Tax=Nonomuraea cypriaca TaxID=1187855 RepID=A0A931EUP7_9ACTN|nr:hypothetical protein [Nonomuraea cypriaca]MBF8184774.1 hypothetical protein [Nonomuraea cypriaca]